MPTYVYECSACAEVFEAEQRITEDPLDTCVCGSKGTIKRVIQPVGVMFKGTGFHINDYAASSSTVEAEPKPETKTSEPPAAPEPKSASPTKPSAD